MMTEGGVVNSAEKRRLPIGEVAMAVTVLQFSSFLPKYVAVLLPIALCVALGFCLFRKAYLPLELNITLFACFVVASALYCGLVLHLSADIIAVITVIEAALIVVYLSLCISHRKTLHLSCILAILWFPLYIPLAGSAG
jgi:hypothetical protein